MKPEKVRQILFENHIPQTVLANAARVGCSEVGLWLRNLREFDEVRLGCIERAVQAILDVIDSSPLPVDWKQFAKIKPVLDRKIVDMELAYAADLRRKNDRLVKVRCAMEAR